MKEQKQTCVFANRKNCCECSALNAYYCEIEKDKPCKFYKSSDEYYLDHDGFVVKKVK